MQKSYQHRINRRAHSIEKPAFLELRSDRNLYNPSKYQSTCGMGNDRGGPTNICSAVSIPSLNIINWLEISRKRIKHSVHFSFYLSYFKYNFNVQLFQPPSWLVEVGLETFLRSLWTLCWIVRCRASYFVITKPSMTRIIHSG